MTIYLRNFEIESLAVVLGNITRRMGTRDGQMVGVNGLTAYKLNKLIKDIGEEAKDWNETKKLLLDQHVEGGSEKPKTKGNQFVFKSEEDKEEYTEVAEAYSGVHLRTLLAEKDLDQLTVTGPEIHFLSLIVEGDARTEEPKPKVEDNLPEEADESDETKELAEAKPVKNSIPKPSKVE